MATVTTHTPTTLKSNRNYQLDAIKLLIAVLVFINHTAAFVGENTSFVIPPSLGTVCVHIFFVISGFLMVLSASKKTVDPTNAGKTALEMTVSKFKQFASKYWTALLIALVLYLYIHYTNSIFSEPKDTMDNN